MNGQRMLYGQKVIPCEFCGVEFVFLKNPKSNKSVPTEVSSFKGEKYFVERVNVNHLRNCAKNVSEKKRMVASVYQVSELYAKRDFTYPIVDEKTGEIVNYEIKRGDVFRCDALSKRFSSNIVQSAGKRLVFTREHLLDEHGELRERVSQFLCKELTREAEQTELELLKHPIAQLIMSEFECEVVG